MFLVPNSTPPLPLLRPCWQTKPSPPSRSSSSGTRSTERRPSAKTFSGECLVFMDTRPGRYWAGHRPHLVVRADASITAIITQQMLWVDIRTSIRNKVYCILLVLRYAGPLRFKPRTFEPFALTTRLSCPCERRSAGPGPGVGIGKEHTCLQLELERYTRVYWLEHPSTNPR